MTLNYNVDLPLHEVAHSRAGDKGDRVNISLIALRPEMYAVLGEQVTAERVMNHFSARSPLSCVRFDLPLMGAYNFVLDGVLEGGVNRSLNLDGHGKTLSSRLLELTVSVPRFWAGA